jgi:hypothetical protein
VIGLPVFGEVAMQLPNAEARIESEN